MCGLAGIFDSRGRRPVGRRLVERMNRTLAHRGPDGEGYHLGPGIGLGHRRLAIIDLAGGAQPLFNEDASVCVVFNGEIYNFQELARELEAAGHVFRTHCDTEVIVHGWEEWGPDCVTRFRGMFAFALWDQTRETLFLARDRFGKKPLYYAPLADGRVLFGSELKALTVVPDLPRELDPLAIEDYLAYGYVPDPRTIYRAARKLPPGHRLLWRRGGEPRIDAYWELRFTGERSLGVAEASEALIAELREAVRLRLISDVPLGAFLSGGVDSSGVVSQMALVSDAPVRTFAIAFGHAAFDESAYARELAERYRTDHHEERVDPDAFDLVDRLAEVYDEPFGDSSAIPTYRVCELARRHVTVALSGDGGDELFAGYRRYLWQVREERIRRLLPAGVRRPLFAALARAYPKLDWAPRVLRAKTTFAELAADTVAGYFTSIAVIDERLRASIVSEAFERALGGYRARETLAAHMRGADSDDPLAMAQYADIKMYLPGDILTKVDRASMAHSLEVRAPLLDHRLGEWSASVPSSLKLKGGEKKYLLKKALEPFVPHHLLYRPKQGFSVPIGAWFRGPLAERVRAAVTSPVLAETGFFAMPVLARLVAQHQAGTRDHSAVLWSLLMLESFLRRDAGLAARAEAA